MTVTQIFTADGEFAEVFTSTLSSVCDVWSRTFKLVKDCSVCLSAEALVQYYCNLLVPNRSLALGSKIRTRALHDPSRELLRLRELYAMRFRELYCGHRYMCRHMNFWWGTVEESGAGEIRSSLSARSLSVMILLNMCGVVIRFYSMKRLSQLDQISSLRACT